MKTEFAIDYIPRRMRELGFNDNYLTRWRHFQIDPNGLLKIDADNEFLMLIEPDESLLVRSKFGVFDLRDTAINEMQYEHRGKIYVRNRNSEISLLVLFIQVIPTHQKK